MTADGTVDAARPAPARILVAESHAVVRHGLRTLVESLGHTVLEANSGGQAVELVGSEPVDLVLADGALPPHGGLDLLRRVRVLRPALPVLILAAGNGLDVVARLYEAGAAGYLPREAGFDRLREAMAAALSGQRTRFEPAGGRRPWSRGPRRRSAARADLSEHELAVLAELVSGDREVGQLISPR
jgi:two-component system invasion response regulator UvrY